MIHFPLIAGIKIHWFSNKIYASCCVYLRVGCYVRQTPTCKFVEHTTNFIFCKRRKMDLTPFVKQKKATTEYLF